MTSGPRAGDGSGTTVIAAIDVVADASAWRRAGLLADGADMVRFGSVDVRVRFMSTADERPGIESWTLCGAGDSVLVDGLATTWVHDPVATPGLPAGLDVRSIDHLVVMTSSLERTCSAITAATGAPLKRIREAGTVRQGFHRLGEVIVEVVETAQVHGDRSWFWGFVLVVDDLDTVCSALGGDVVSAPRDAVQPGRRIATFRQGAGLGVPLALITPDVR